MTYLQRIKNDTTTTDKRERADNTMRNSRVRSDELTRARRFKADKAMGDNRSRNDETTANRREVKDSKPSMTLSLFLVVLLILIVGADLIFF